MGFIYLITNKITGKQYVGQTMKTVEARWKEHCYTNPTRRFLLHKAIQKYGKENFEIKVLAESTVEIFLDDLEKIYIKQYNTLAPIGYNLESGGNKNKRLSESVKQKIKESNTGWNCTQPTKKKITCLCLATGIEKSYNGMYFAQADGFCRTAIVNCCNGKTYSHKGYRWKNAQEEDYPKMDFKKIPTGIKKTRYNKYANAFTQNVFGVKLKAVSLLDSSELIFSNRLEAHKKGFDKTNISRCLNGKQKTYRGYVWGYISGS